LFSLLFQSCKKQLEEHPYSSLSSSNVFVNEDGLKKAIYGVYQGFYGPNFFTPFFLFELTETEQRYSTFGMFTPGYDVDTYEKFGEQPTTGPGGAVWTMLYTVISRANTVIDNASNAVGEQNAQTYIAEARC